MEFLSHMVIVFLNILRSFYTVFHSGYTYLYSHQQCTSHISCLFNNSLVCVYLRCYQSFTGTISFQCSCNLFSYILKIKTILETWVSILTIPLKNIKTLGKSHNFLWLQVLHSQNEGVNWYLSFSMALQ